MESSPRATPDAARTALLVHDDARRRLAEQLASPWWYRWGSASGTASMFVGTGLIVGRPEAGSGTESTAMMIVVFGAVLAPMVLLWALKRSTGVSIERYSEGLGTWCAVVFALLVAGFVLQAFAGVSLALPIAGVGAFVATLLTERRIDGLLRRRVRSA